MPLWARLRRGGENDGAGRRSHGREADGRPGSAQRNAAPDFARQLQKVGPMIGQPGFAAGEMRPNGSKGRGGSAGPHLSGAKMGERARCPRRGQRPASPVSPQAKCDRMGARAGFLPLGTRRGRAVTGTAKYWCGVAKPWPRSGQPHRVVSRSEMPRAILRGKPKRRGR